MKWYLLWLAKGYIDNTFLLQKQHMFKFHIYVRIFYICAIISKLGLFHCLNRIMDDLLHYLCGTIHTQSSKFALFTPVTWYTVLQTIRWNCVTIAAVFKTCTRWIHQNCSCILYAFRHWSKRVNLWNNGCLEVLSQLN